MLENPEKSIVLIEERRLRVKKLSIGDENSSWAMEKLASAILCDMG